MPFSKSLERFQGIFVPLVTPTNVEGEIDDEPEHERDKFESSCLESLVNYVIGDGIIADVTMGKSQLVDGIIVNGTTGEFPFLDYEKRRYNSTWVVFYTGKRVPVIANVTDDKREGDYKKVLERTQRNIDVAIGSGADGILCCPLYYQNITNKNIYEFVSEVADVKIGKIPFFLYNNPNIHSEEELISPEAVSRLQKNLIIDGIKDSSGDLGYFMQILALKSDSFKVFQGSEKLIYESFKGEVKPDGIVPSLANAAPEFVRFFYENISRENQRKMDKACQLLYGEDYKNIIPGIKYALSEMGIISTNLMFDRSHIKIDDYHIKLFNEIIRLNP